MHHRSPAAGAEFNSGKFRIYLIVIHILKIFLAHLAVAYNQGRLINEDSLCEVSDHHSILIRSRFCMSNALVIETIFEMLHVSSPGVCVPNKASSGFLFKYLSTWFC